MDFVNQFFIEPLGKSEKFPFTVTLKDLETGVANVLVSAHRMYVKDVDGSEQVDISSVVQMIALTNKCQILNIWKASNDTPKPGKYRIRILVRDPSSITIVEANGIVEVKN